MRKATLMFVASLAALTFLAVVWMQRGRPLRPRRSREIVAAATPARTERPARAERPRAALSWSIDGPPEATARVAAQLSAEQWSKHLRDEVCACRDAACATAVQHSYASNFGAIDFGSGDQERILSLRDEASACTRKLLDAARRGG